MRRSVRVHLLDCTWREVEIGPATTIQEGCMLMCQKLGLLDARQVASNFGLFTDKNGTTGSLQLAMNTDLMGLVFDRCCKLVFKLVAMLPSCERSQDPGMLHLRFIQAIDEIVGGKLGLTTEQFCHLGALQLQQRFGAFNAQLHKSGFVMDRLFELVPEAELAARKPTKWEHDITRAYKELANKPIDPVVDLLEVVRHQALFGVTLFRCTGERQLGVSARGLVIVQFGPAGADCQEVVWEQVYSWGAFDVNSVYFRHLGPGGEPGELERFTTADRAFATVGEISRVANAVIAERFPEANVPPPLPPAPAAPINAPELEPDRTEREEPEQGQAQEAPQARHGPDDEAKFRAAVMLQKCARGVLTRKWVDELLAALCIQEAWRSYVETRALDDVGWHESDDDSRGDGRDLVVLDGDEGLPTAAEEEAAVRIQSNFRGFLDRQEFSRMEREYAAVFLQIWFRRCRSRTGSTPQPPELEPPVPPPPGLEPLPPGEMESIQDNGKEYVPSSSSEEEDGGPGHDRISDDDAPAELPELPPSSTQFIAPPPPSPSETEADGSVVESDTSTEDAHTRQDHQDQADSLDESPPPPPPPDVPPPGLPPPGLSPTEAPPPTLPPPPSFPPPGFEDDFDDNESFEGDDVEDDDEESDNEEEGGESSPPPPPPDSPPPAAHTKFVPPQPPAFPPPGTLLDRLSEEEEAGSGEEEEYAV